MNEEREEREYDEHEDSIASYYEAVRECGIHHRATGELGAFFRSEKDIA